MLSVFAEHGIELVKAVKLDLVTYFQGFLHRQFEIKIFASILRKLSVEEP